MIDRRGILAGGGAAIAMAATPHRVLAGGGTAGGSLKVASLKFGSLSWLIETIRAEGLEAATGFKLDVLDVATNQAGPVALLAGEADVIVSDWTWALRQRAMGDKVKFAPYSAALGSLMVAADSPIRSLGDLKGKKLGVAGTAIDKSWILLRAYAKKTLGEDIAEITTPVFGAAPLMTEEIRSGRIDAVLNFWTFAARLQGAGFRQIVSMADVLKGLEVDPAPALVGYIWKEETAQRKAKELLAFLEAARRGNAVLKTSDPAWERIRGLVKPATDGEFTAIRDYYRAGVPGPWGKAETASAEKLVGLLLELGSKDVMGSGTRFDADLFHTATG